MKSILRKIAVIAFFTVLAFGMFSCSNGSSDDQLFPPATYQDYSTCAVGDFILKDGTILSKDKILEDGTVAVVIVRATAEGIPALGVGIVHSSTGLRLCNSTTQGYSTNITALQGDETGGYMDGSDGWKKLTEVCSDAQDSPGRYPA